jgi:hypothetical protein
MNATTNTISSAGRTGGTNIFGGLMWRHWLAGRWAIMGALAVLLTGGWALMLFHHPGWIIGAGSIFAMIAGVIFGGLDAADGSEEFAFSLPPTRSQRYLSGIIIGGGGVLAFCLIGTLSIALDLPQFAWALVVDSGFTTPFGPWPRTYLYFLAVVIPLLVFACTHICASLSQTRGAVWFSWLPALIVAGLAVLLGCMAEDELWGEPNGYICVPSMLAIATMLLLFGHTRYVRKEGVSRPGRSGESSNARGVFIVVAIVMVFALTMSWYVANVTHDSSVILKDPGPTSDPGSATGKTHIHPPTTPTAPEDEEKRIVRETARARAIAQQTRVAERAAERASQGYSIVTPMFSGVVLLVVLLVVFLAMCRKRNFRAAPSRRPRNRHIVTRSVCGLLAVTILAAIGFFSWRQANAIYLFESSEPGSVRVRTKTPAVLAAEKPDHDLPLDKARLLIKAVVMEATETGGLRAVRTDEFDVAWRSGRTAGVSKHFKLGDRAISYQMNISNISVHLQGRAAEPTIQGDGYWSMRIDGASGEHSAGSEGVDIADNIAIVQDIWGTHGNNKPLSTVPTVARHGRLILCVFVDLADADDKLAAIPVEQFLTSRDRQITARTRRSNGWGSSNRRWRVDREVPLMANLVDHIGMSSMLLALAAILLGQLFTRRGLATAAMLAMIVLYVAAIDRITLELHMSHAQDATAPLDKRMLACKAAFNTFFFARTASNQLGDLTDDKQNPEHLRFRARRLSILLKAIADIGHRGYNHGPAWTNRRLSLPAPERGSNETLRWEITTYRTGRDKKPFMVVAQAISSHMKHSRLTPSMLWTVVSSQVNATGRIAIVGPSLRAIVIGDENDMAQAARAANSKRFMSSDSWTGVILPAAKKLTEDQP